MYMPDLCLPAREQLAGWRSESISSGQISDVPILVLPLRGVWTTINGGDLRSSWLVVRTLGWVWEPLGDFSAGSNLGPRRISKSTFSVCRFSTFQNGYRGLPLRNPSRGNCGSYLANQMYNAGLQPWCGCLRPIDSSSDWSSNWCAHFLITVLLLSYCSALDCSRWGFKGVSRDPPENIAVELLHFLWILY